MSENESFAEKIRQRLSQLEKDRAVRQLQVDGDMEQLLSNREKYSAEARRLLQSIVYPRMRELSIHFDNCRLSPLDEEAERCRCEFSHTQRFPATVSFAIGFMAWETSEALSIYYDLEILPIHIEYKTRDELNFVIGSQGDDEIAQWVEGKILYFVDKYLQLETHPTYQKDSIVRDPVCGMEISANEAVGKVERGKQTFFFCSNTCRQAFLRGGK